MDKLDPLALQDNPVDQDQMVQSVTPVMLAKLETLEPQELSDNLVQMDHQDHWVPLELLDLAGSLVHLGARELEDPQGLRDKLVHKVSRDQRDSLGPLDQAGHPVSEEIQDRQELQDLLDSPDLMVSRAVMVLMETRDRRELQDLKGKSVKVGHRVE